MKKVGTQPRSTEISSSIPDWSREDITRPWDPGKKLLRALRDYQSFRESNSLFRTLRMKICVLRHRFWSVVAGADIPIDCQLGGGLLLTHPNGIVIHPKAKIGPNCLILQQVTIVEGVVLEGHVDVLAGAKLVKPVTIGEHSIIGSNAVVTRDVPPRSTAVGVPASVRPSLPRLESA